MALTYMKTVREIKETQVEKTIEVHDQWGMFTSAGNKSLKKKAEKFLTAIEKATTIKAKLDAFEKYFKAYKKTGQNKTMREATDTDVRERIWYFAKEVAEAINFDQNILDRLWDEAIYR